VSSRVRVAAAPKAAAQSGAAFTPPPRPWEPGSLVQAAFQHGVLLHALQGQVLGYKPTAQASQFPASGVDAAPTVAGMINAYAEGQSLEYTVTEEPLNGIVDIAGDGSFIYTPDPDFAAEGGNDVFSIKVTNTAGTLLNLLGAPGLSSDVTVPVSIAPYDDTAAALNPPGSGYVYADFHIYNTSYRPVEIVYYGNYINVEGGPAVGTVLAPAGQKGSSVFWTLDEIGKSPQVQVGLAVVGDPGTYWTVDFATKPGNGSGHDLATCSSTGGGSQCATDGYTSAYLMDPAGTKVTIDSSDAQQQSDYLASLCDSSFSNCSYDFGLVEPIVQYTNPVVPTGFSGYVNDAESGSGPTDVEKFYTTITSSSTSSVTYTNSVTTTLTVGQKDVMNASIAYAYSEAYGQALTLTSTTTVEIDATVPAGESYYLYYELPLMLQWGDWYLTYGATTYHLVDVWYLNPQQSFGQPVNYGYHCLTGDASCAYAKTGYQQYPVQAPPSVIAQLPTPSYVLD
jgi:hypothetical protein